MSIFINIDIFFIPSRKVAAKTPRHKVTQKVLL
jgi:hypothetical protein